MARKRETSQDLDREICLLVAQGTRSPVKILQRLRADARFRNVATMTARTIGNRVRQCDVLDDSEPWSPLDDNPESARRIVPVFTWAFGETGARVWLSQAIAHWVDRVCALAEMPPEWAWSFAMAYQWATLRNEETRCLDLVLVHQVWGFEVGKRLDEDGQDPEQARMEVIQHMCRHVAPNTWETQWSDLFGFVRWNASANMLPIWLDEEEFED